MQLPPLEPHRGVETVLMDIDDTLWENNLYFIKSIRTLAHLGSRVGYTAKAVEHLLNRMEDRVIPQYGLGYDSYEFSYMQAVVALIHSGKRPDLAGEFSARARRSLHELRYHPIQWIGGVLITLPELTRRFPTIIVTKGSPRDQLAKVNRCGMAHLFKAAEVVPHKNPDCYAEVLTRHGLDPARTVMVGNSPRSDINQARRVGLRTVYIPHALTWYREMEPIRAEGPRNITIDCFDQLLDVLEK